MSIKYKLEGFNNLTKTLSINFYQLFYTNCDASRFYFTRQMDHLYNAKTLTALLKELTHMIDANILNIARQDYEPHGASVNVLISEGATPVSKLDESCNSGILSCKESIVGHLDKSHITVHTYPESHASYDISTMRIDIDISTCGEISPLKSLDYLINLLPADMLTIDYRIRGFTRDIHGNKLFMDHKMASIQDYMTSSAGTAFHYKDYNSIHKRLFHTQMYRKQLSIADHVMPDIISRLSKDEESYILDRLCQEMTDIMG